MNFIRTILTFYKLNENAYLLNIVRVKNHFFNLYTTPSISSMQWNGMMELNMIPTFILFLRYVRWSEEMKLKCKKIIISFISLFPLSFSEFTRLLFNNFLSLFLNTLKLACMKSCAIPRRGHLPWDAWADPCGSGVGLKPLVKKILNIFLL